MSATASEYVTFVGVKGSNLAARLDRPIGKPHAYALFGHCFACSRDGAAASRISTILAERGIAVLRFDLTGLGSADNDFASTSYASNTLDLVTAADYLRQYYRAPELLIGHSLGGAAALAAAGVIPELKAVITIGAPSGVHSIKALLRDSIGDILDSGEANVRLAQHDFAISRDLIEDMDEGKVLEAASGMGRSLILFHAPEDEVVGFDNANRIFAAAKHPKSLISLDGADHWLGHDRDAAYVGEMIASWATRHLGAEDGAMAEMASPPSAPGVVLIAESEESRSSQTMTAGRHILRADQPVVYGGADTGPSPYDHLLAALGACTSMTLRQYADQAGLQVTRIAVRLTHGNVYAEDCQSGTGHLDRIERDILVPGDLDSATQTRLLEIADRSPVLKALGGKIKVVTRMIG
ncbi:MAG: bifunctional alpha/beta hydrolase/OsmC family protein [Alphaproteobacteria bacterium]|nr:bifunctional alpha/beta hydrolase/OsmC family protein [Alphaproteobacteria bacterium]